MIFFLSLFSLLFPFSHCSLSAADSEEHHLVSIDRRTLLKDYIFENRYNFVCSLKITFNRNDQTEICYGSGVIIAPNLILTAAHNISLENASLGEIHLIRARYDDENLGEDIIRLAADGKDERIYIHSRYKKDLSANIALIKVKGDNFVGNHLISARFIGFQDGKVKIKPIVKGSYELEFYDAIITGYGRRFPYTMKGKIRSVHNSMISYDIDTEACQSGSGIYFEPENKGGDVKRYCIGVHAYSGGKQYNSGVLIDDEIENEIKKHLDELLIHDSQGSWWGCLIS